MAIQIVMDRSGDSRHVFNPDDAQDLVKAEQRFYELTKVGFTAAVRTGPGVHWLAQTATFNWLRHVTARRASNGYL